MERSTNSLDNDCRQPILVLEIPVFRNVSGSFSLHLSVFLKHNLSHELYFFGSGTKQRLVRLQRRLYVVRKVG